MKARADIGAGIKAVEPGNKACEYIVTGKGGDSQLLAAGPEHVEKDRPHKGRDQEPDKVLEFLCVIQQSIDLDKGKLHEPEKVGDHKEFAERDQIVCKALHGMIVRMDPEPFQCSKGKEVYRPEEQILQMPVFLLVYFIQAEMTVIYDGLYGLTSIVTTVL